LRGLRGTIETTETTGITETTGTTETTEIIVEMMIEGKMIEMIGEVVMEAILKDKIILPAKRLITIQISGSFIRMIISFTSW
jgi:Na+-translocating ferredoxin:NAD+ oxidoreductase RnfD subunit